MTCSRLRSMGHRHHYKRLLEGQADLVSGLARGIARVATWSRNRFPESLEPCITCGYKGTREDNPRIVPV